MDHWDLEPSSFPSPSTPLRRDEEMSTLFFRDGMRKIDFVLAYEDSDFRRNEYRDMFQKNLRKAGLELEIEDKSLSQDGKTYFLKIHAPYSILRKHAEVLNIKRPIKHKYAEETTAGEDIKPEKENFFVRFFPSSFRDLFSYDRALIPDDIDKSDQNFRGNSVNGTLGSRSSCRDVIKYTDAQRSRIVWEILIRTPHHGDGRASTGVLYLVSNGTYTAAYPLHDGPYGKGAYEKEEGEPNLRREQIRPEYESTVKNYRLNPVTMAIEPFLPFWSKVYRIAAANSAVLFVVCLHYPEYLSFVFN
ncbi:Anoctamin-5 [Araneus ventricosus]|uniref:Anoctamin-5 n=1 Tax=Araneus ventricosus TaxID=182803 RepID=A0A4Y2JFR5_ARAVE|nr:Anoctamin-5 [Araneus ventricosus]